MLVLRPVEQTDLTQLQQLARDSLVGVTSLPDDSERLREKIAGSCASFASDATAHGPENYFFVLEDLDNHRLVGCSEILATAGYDEPFYSLRNRHFTSASRELNIEHGVPALSLCHDLNDHTLLRGFHIDAALVRTPFSELLSRARLLFIAAHAQRFADAVITEIVGYSDENGHSPFWDALGKHFFDLPYVEAERLCGMQSRAFLAELFRNTRSMSRCCRKRLRTVSAGFIRTGRKRSTFLSVKALKPTATSTSSTPARPVCARQTFTRSSAARSRLCSKTPH